MQMNCLGHGKLTLGVNVEHMALRPSNPTVTRQLIEGGSKLTPMAYICKAAREILQHYTTSMWRHQHALVCLVLRVSH
jgi:hypothetical protein